MRRLPRSAAAQRWWTASAAAQSGYCCCHSKPLSLAHLTKKLWRPSLWWFPSRFGRCSARGPAALRTSRSCVCPERRALSHADAWWLYAKIKQRKDSRSKRRTNITLFLPLPSIEFFLLQRDSREPIRCGYLTLACRLQNVTWRKTARNVNGTLSALKKAPLSVPFHFTISDRNS